MKRLGYILLTSLLLAACRPQGPRVGHLELLPEGEVQWDDWTPATLLTSEGDTLWVDIHYRGGYSSRFEKHSYALRLPYPTNLEGLPDSKRFILNASFVDRTFLRHKLSYDIFRSMDSNNRAPLCAYTTLSVDGEEEGLYVLMQRLNDKVLGLDRHNDGALLFKEPGLTPEGNEGEEQKYPKPEVRDGSADLSTIRSLINDTPDSLFYAAADSAFDLRNVADLHLLILLTNNADGLTKGYYLYRTATGAKWRFAPWDYDHSFGRDGDGEPNMLERMANDTVAPLLRRLLQTETYPALLAARWHELRNAGVIDCRSLLRTVDIHARALRSAAEADTRRWPDDPTGYFPTLDYRHEIQIIKDFIPLSIQRLDHRFGYRGK